MNGLGLLEIFKGLLLKNESDMQRFFRVEYNKEYHQMVKNKVPLTDRFIEDLLEK